MQAKKVPFKVIANLPVVGYVQMPKSRRIQREVFYGWVGCITLPAQP